MKTTILALAVMVFAPVARVFAQNLVPNGSFEEYSLCPDNQSQIERAIGWQACRGTCDYLNSCGIEGVTGVPHNIWGWQTAAIGDGYAQLISFSADDGNPYYLREWIGASLAEPCVVGQTYYVSVKFSWTTSLDTLLGSCQFANDHMGVRFTASAYTSSDADPVPNAAQVWSSQVITDSVGWTTVVGSFIADSAYTFVSVGNFFDDEVTNGVMLDSSGAFAISYYYVDDVCVSDQPNGCLDPHSGWNEHQRDEITVFPDPFIDRFNVVLEDAGVVDGIWLLDSRGIPNQISYQQRDNRHVEVNPRDMPAGMACLVIHLSSGEVLHHRLIHLTQ